MFSQNLKPSQITFYKTYSACWLFHKSCCFKSRFLGKPNLETQLEVLQFQKIVSRGSFILWIFFHCYLLSIVRKKIYRNLGCWKEILTIQNSWSFLWIKKKIVIFTLERNRTWGHLVFWGEAPQNTKWPSDWAIFYTRKVGTRGY